MAESFSIKAILSAQVAGFVNSMKGATKPLEGFSSAYAQMEASGVSSMKSLSKGTSGLVKGFGGLAAAAERAIRAKARIHSPSKVSQALGEYWGTGYAMGISGMVRSVRKASERLVTVPTLTAGPDLSYHGSLEQDFDYYRNAQYTVQVPVTVDGREFARATATYTQEELNKRQTRYSRKHGIL